MKNYLKTLLLLVLLVTNSVIGQNLYDINTIRSFNLNFYDTNWDEILDSYQLINSEARVLADLVVDGTTYDSVGVRFKGNSSYRPDRTKNPFNIEIDYVKEQDLYGYTTIKLSNMFKDPSCVREIISYEMLQHYIPASKANYINLYINNIYHGFYTNVESVNKSFINNHFGSNSNSFFKCDPITITGSPQPPPAGCKAVQGIASPLIDMGDDTGCYKQSYELKSDEETAWFELKNLIGVLNGNPDSVFRYLNIDRVLWMIAFNNIFVNFDSYTGSGHNYYLYEDNFNRFNPVVWDLNENFGVFKNGGQGHLDLLQMQQLSPLWNINNVDRPLIKELLSIPKYRKKYFAHYRTIVNDFLQNGKLKTRAVELQDLIDTYVLNDPNKLYSYDDFQNNLDKNVGFGPGEIYGINVLMDARYNYLSNDQEIIKQGPVISDINQSPDRPARTDSVWITCQISNSDIAILYFKNERNMPFINIKMFDDGNHMDDMAGDGTYGALIPAFPVSTTVDYYIYAENNSAGKFSPERAEYEYYSYTIQASQNDPGDLVINEFMASNSTTVADQDGEYNDWIELYNNSSNDINMNGMTLSDDFTEPEKWTFPDTIIKSHSFLIIWTDSDSLQEGLHTPFKLSKAGEDIILTDSNKIVIDQLSFPPQTTDISYGRYPNGTGVFGTMPSTFNDINTFFLSADNDLDSETIKVYPNPCKSKIFIDIPANLDGKKEIIITDLLGKVLIRKELQKGNNYMFVKITLDLSKLDQGVYCLVLKSSLRSFSQIIYKTN